MIVIRNVFHCKPGKAKELVERFRESMPGMMSEAKVPFARILTDISASFWTVVIETETESLEAWENEVRSRPAVRGGLSYMELVEGGHREIWRVEYESQAE